jgi:DNA-binding MarR family transcriptional regulator
VDAERFNSKVNRYMSQYGLTQQQARVMVLKFEFDLNISDIARYLNLSRKTVDEHYAAADKRMNPSKH